MGEVSTIGLDIAKSVFQVHGVDSSGAVVIRKRVGRLKLLEFFAALPPCLIGIEACPSAHHWGRDVRSELEAEAAERQRKALRAADCPSKDENFPLFLTIGELDANALKDRSLAI